MHWRIKGVMQKVLGFLPMGDLLHFHLQRVDQEQACVIDGLTQRALAAESLHLRFELFQRRFGQISRR